MPGLKLLDHKGRVRTVQYQISACCPKPPPKKPAGTYVCPECTSTMIIWRTPIDKYKIRCPKCSVEMERIGPPTRHLPTGERTTFGQVYEIPKTFGLMTSIARPITLGPKGLGRPVESVPLMAGANKTFGPATAKILTGHKDTTALGAPAGGAWESPVRRHSLRERPEIYPFKSKAQRRWMHATHPEMAKKWEEHTPVGKLPEKVKQHSLAGIGAVVGGTLGKVLGGAAKLAWKYPTTALTTGMVGGMGVEALRRKRKKQQQYQSPEVPGKPLLAGRWGKAAGLGGILGLLGGATVAAISKRKELSRFATGWRLGQQQGKDEAEGTKSPPGAAKLAILQSVHGNGFILGRQNALSRAGMAGGTRAKIGAAGEVLKLVKENLGG